MGKSKDTFKKLKNTTFSDLWDTPDVPLKPIDEEEFLEDVVAKCYKTLENILMDPDEKAYTKIKAIEMLLDRSKGKPTVKAEIKDISDKPTELTDEQLKLAISIAMSQQAQEQDHNDHSGDK